MAPKPAPTNPFVAPKPTELAAGTAFGCVIRSQGRVACWGDNRLGQLGDGSRGHRLGAVLVSGLQGAVEVAAGGDSACARKASGAVWCWGQLGGATGEPKQIAKVTAEHISVGRDYACTVRQGRVTCWGSHDSEYASEKGEPIAPTPVANLAGAVAVAAMRAGGCARKNDGTVACWTRPKRFTRDPEKKVTLTADPVVDLANVVEIDAIKDVACARLASPGEQQRTVLCWTPGDTELKAPLIEPLVKAQGVHLGDGFGCLQGVWSLVCWGREPGPPREYYGSEEDEIRRVTSLVRPTAVAAGDHHMCGRIASGEVLCWGSNEQGQLGVSSGAMQPRPQPVSGLSGVKHLASGAKHLCASGKNVTCWGDSSGARLGRSHGSSPNVVAALTGPVGKLSAHEHTCAVTNGQVSCWGESGWGQLGSEAAKTKPKKKNAQGGLGMWRSASGPSFVRQVDGLSGVTDVATSPDATCAVTSAGVSCWGRARLTDAHSEPCTSYPMPVGFSDRSKPALSPAEQCKQLKRPQLVAGTSGALVIVGLDAGFCALLADKVVCWNSAQLAAGLKPRLVPNLDRPSALFAGGDEACALDASKRLFCWTYKTMYPRPPRGLAKSLAGAKVVRAASGTAHGCAVDDKGRVHCWGSNDSGQLGPRSSGSRQPAAIVPGISDALSVALGSGHSCALRKAGDVWCWGGPRNIFGGGKLLLESTTPLAVEGLP